MSLESYKAVNNRVLLEPIVEEVKTSSGIILPDKPSRSKLSKGKVILSADELIKPGETAFHRPGRGTDVPIDGKVYLIIESKEIDLIRV